MNRLTALSADTYLPKNATQVLKHDWVGSGKQRNKFLLLFWQLT